MKKKNKKVILILIIKWTLILVPQFLLFTIAHWLVIFTIWKYPGVFTFASCFFCCPVHRVVYSRICFLFFVFFSFASVNECFTHLQIWIFRKKINSVLISSQKGPFIYQQTQKGIIDNITATYVDTVKNQS